MQKNPCNYFKQIEENLWRCSFCGETITEKPAGWVDHDWRAALKPGFKVYSDPLGAAERLLMDFKSKTVLDEGFIYAPYPFPPDSDASRTE